MGKAEIALVTHIPGPIFQPSQSNPRYNEIQPLKTLADV